MSEVINPADLASWQTFRANPTQHGSPPPRTALALVPGPAAIAWAIRDKAGSYRWAFTDPRPRSREGYGARFGRLADFLDNIDLEVGRLSFIAYETDRHYSDYGEEAVTRGIEATISAWCERHGIATFPILRVDWQRRLMGRTRANKRRLLLSLSTRLEQVPTTTFEASALALMLVAEQLNACSPIRA